MTYEKLIARCEKPPFSWLTTHLDHASATVLDIGAPAKNQTPVGMKLQGPIGANPATRSTIQTILTGVPQYVRRLLGPRAISRVFTSM